MYSFISYLPFQRTDLALYLPSRLDFLCTFRPLFWWLKKVQCCVIMIHITRRIQSQKLLTYLAHLLDITSLILFTALANLHRVIPNMQSPRCARWRYTVRIQTKSIFNYCILSSLLIVILINCKRYCFVSHLRIFLSYVTIAMNGCKI